MAHIRTAAKAYDADGKHTGPGEWLDLIHEANRIETGFFLSPDSTGPWWAGGYVEEYPHARVLHREDETVSVTSKTPHGEAILRLAARALGMQVVDS